MIESIAAAVARYPYPHEYRAWPGPNSITFTAYIARQGPGSQCRPRRRRAGTKAAGDRPIRVGPLTR
jgi:hypothetical protein